jgi:hypothetical protein
MTVLHMAAWGKAYVDISNVFFFLTLHERENM